MTEHIPTPLATRRLVAKHEELRRKREGTWDPTTMVSQTSPEGAALRAHRASPDKVTDAQPIAIELLKNRRRPNSKRRASSRQKNRKATVKTTLGWSRFRPETTRLRTSRHRCPRRKLSRCRPARRPRVRPRNLKQRQPHSQRLAANQVGAAVANPRRKNRRRESRNPPQSFRPKIMRIVLNTLRERPILHHAAHEADIHRKTLERWIRRSEAGDNGYDIRWQGITHGDFTNTANRRSGEAHQNTRGREAPKGIPWLRKSSDRSGPGDLQDRPGTRGARFSRPRRLPEGVGPGSLSQRPFAKRTGRRSCMS